MLSKSWNSLQYVKKIKKKSIKKSIENLLKISYLKLLFNVCNEQLACKLLLYKLYPLAALGIIFKVVTKKLKL